MDTLFVSIAVIIAGGVAGLLLYRQFTLMKLVAIATTSAGCGIGLFFTLPNLFSSAAYTVSYNWLHVCNLAFSIDSVSLFFLIPIFVIPPLALIYSFHYLENSAKKFRAGVNYFFFSVLVASMALVVMSANMITFLLAWELMSLSSFFLVMYDYEVESNRKAGYLYFIFAQGGAMLLFAAFALIYSHTASFDFTSFATIPDQVKLYVFIIAFLGFGSKAGIFPLHIWLPKAHPAAPSHISAIMSGVMIKMGIYGIFRIYLLLDTPTPLIGQIVLVTGMVTGILGVVYALAKQDIKSMLAYSSVENIGIILIGLGIGMVGVSEQNQAMAFFGFAGAMMHVFNHSIFKSLLFMGAGAVLHKTKTKNIEELGGLMKRMPFTGRTFLVGSVAISGLPPFSGFIGEFLIYYGAFQGLSSQKLPFILIVLSIVSLAVIGGLAAACFTKVVGLAFLGEPRTENAANAKECGMSMRLVMGVMALACLAVGVLPEPFVNLAFLGIANIQTAAGFSTASFIVIIRNISQTAALFIGIFILVSILRKVLYARKEIGSGGTWGCGFTQPTVRMQYTGASYADEMVSFFKPFVPITTLYSGIREIFPGQTTWSIRVADIAESNYQRFLTTPLLNFVTRMKWIQHGNIQLYIGYIIVAIVVLLLFL
ncbi:formate hydrogenlyase subunit 3/multisubunit Na+/H+ antiporter, MnhD subunit [Desulfocapsa sulfexigens DSM 10523]|uniref:Formate hydrogenlyase subunit 3/multisubunit Na+/H+ antiporter, MnhD subunit n=1 Tax=Desulfocapsa sulfexigens (strain DSM 10523 / SB164P1) TaxID=1167006 RepID=M1P1N9_DESSD|nr:proton-conducting transporter membrane subunit [Desulfocapsa sulfexigens]AGF77413.1 formate hydrogenlyase subunit 3/multisubunit Na+/H+ antiporter, MnhD subunit [Desulfocapsa sulfexigens DSM 10523]